MRPDQGIPKVTVLLTDGYSNGRAVSGPANQLRKQGVNIFSIGVGYNVNPSELKTIASDPDSTHVFRMSSFNDLSGWVDKLSAVSCDGEWYIFEFDNPCSFCSESYAFVIHCSPSLISLFVPASFRLCPSIVNF